MLIRLRGHSREVTQELYLRKYKAMGYEIVENVPEPVEEEDLMKLSKVELYQKLEEMEIEYEPAMNKATLIKLLGE